MRDTIKCISNLFVISVLSAALLGGAFFAGLGTAILRPAADAPAPLSEQTSDATSAPDRQTQFALFWEAWDLLQENFYGEMPDIPTASRDAVRGVLAKLGDPNTALVNPQIAKVLNDDISGEFEGIGASVRTDENGYFTIVQPYDGSPAQKAGLEPGDIVLNVDGKDITGLTTTEVVSMIRGPKDTAVALDIFRPSTQEELSISVVRAKIDIPTIEARTLDDGIAYIRLREFNAVSGRQIHQALADALRDDPQGLILDLRSNPGGLLDEAIAIGSEFVGSGNIAEERFKDGSVTTHEVQKGGLATNPSLPLVVLVNGGSASASEIVAGAIQDTGRGLLVGDQTYGKGSVQLPRTLSDGSQLRITIAHWFTPNGKDITKEGLTPDETVELNWEEYQAGKDAQLDRAVQILLEKAGARSSLPSAGAAALVVL